MTEEEKDLFDQEETPGLKVWLEDNLRILLSILVVIAIAGGIYSYSKRTEAPAVTEKAATEQKGNESSTDTSNSTADTQKANTQKAADQTTKTAPETTKTAPKATAPVTATSSETDTAFVITAVRGQGETHLARQALADYLAKNPDSQLTKEHKIYIEDYLRKHNAFAGYVRVGTSVEFQKDLIQKAIGASKSLSGQQLNHLKQYSARVPSLS